MSKKIDYTNRNPLRKIKKNIYIKGRRTSMSFEDYVWEQLEHLGHQENMTVDEICTEIELRRPEDLNISTVIRYLTVTISTMRETQSADVGFELNETARSFPSALHTVLADVDRYADEISLNHKARNDGTHQGNSKMSL